jgi:hypothetical protein
MRWWCTSAGGQLKHGVRGGGKGGEDGREDVKYRLQLLL